MKRIRKIWKRFLAMALVLFLTAGAFSPAAMAYTHDKQFNKGYTVYQGIDVSHHQGAIDWAKVKKAGVKFAFIRCGGTYYGKSSGFTQYTDNTFTYNIKNAIKNGIQVGVYFFSQAKSTAEAKKEAEYVLKLVKGYQLDLPIVFDEECESSSYRFQWSNYSKKQCTDFALAFCDKVASAGYDACVYNSTSRFVGSGAKYDVSSILNKGYQIWVARYGSTASYTSGKTTYSVNGYSYWQYTASGKVNGISGNVDMDYWYCKDKSAIQECVEVDDDTALTKLTVKSSASVQTGQTVTLAATVTPSGSQEPLVWSSSDPQVAYVDGSGNVTGVSVGTATVTVSNSNGTIQAKCTVTVQGENADETLVLTYGEPSFELNDVSELGAASYEPLEDGVLTVTAEGTVTINGAGVTTVTANVPKPEDSQPDDEPEVPGVVPEEPKQDGDVSDTGNTGESSEAGDDSEQNDNAEQDETTQDDTALDDAVLGELAADLNTVETPEPEKAEEKTASEQEEEPSEPSTEQKTIRVVVDRRSISDAVVKLTKTTYSYTGKTVTPQISSVTLDGKKISSSAYQLYANNNINRGKASAVVVGVGNYQGAAVSDGFYIRSDQVIYTEETSYTKTYGNSAFYLKAKNCSEYGGALSYKSSNTSVVTVSSTGKVTIKGAGTATITITAAENDRYNKTTAKVQIKVKPAKVTLSSVSAGKKKLTVKWKTTSCTGYQIQYSTSSSFKSVKTIKITNKKTASRVISGLKAKKKYYIRVRAYYKSGSTTLYGAWSSKKSAKTK